MEEKTKKLAVNIIGGLIGFGLGLALVSMFLGVVVCKSSVPLEIDGKTRLLNDSLSLFDKDYATLGINNTFAILSFIITAVGAIILGIDASLRNKAGKDLRIMRIVGIVITAVGSVLILVSGILLANDIEDFFVGIALDAAKSEMGSQAGVTDEMLIIAIKQIISVKIYVGVYLGFIGGLCATIGGVLLLLKPFAPTKPTAEAPVTEATANEQVQPQATATIDPFADNNANNDNNNNTVL